MVNLRVDRRFWSAALVVATLAAAVLLVTRPAVAERHHHLRFHRQPKRFQRGSHSHLRRRLMPSI